MRPVDIEPAATIVWLQVVRQASEAAPSFTLVYVPSSLKSSPVGFRFALPELGAPDEARDSGLRVTTLDGAALPDWMQVDLKLRWLVASKVPPGGLPLRVLVISGGKCSVLELLETNT
jgi:hypothetical protein